jgi:hypothetical protein
MRKADRSARGWWITLLLVVALLAGCSTEPTKKEPVSTSTKEPNNKYSAELSKYENSLRSEATWLWDNMNYARTHTVGDDEHCAPKDFKHEPVTMDADARQTNDLAARILDQLDYAFQLIGQSRDEWGLYCQRSESADVTTAFLQSRLDPAFKSLNVAKDALTQWEVSVTQAAK